MIKKLQILGTGCQKCRLLAEKTEEAAKELNLKFQLEKIEDINEILQFGVMMTPALVVDGKVKLVGKIPKTDELKDLLR